MRYALAILSLIVLPATSVLAEKNPFLKPDVRNPPKPVQVAPSTQHMMGVPGASGAMPVIDNAMAPPQETGAVANAKLIAVINGEEVWFKTDEKIYVRQKERDGSKIRLQEALTTQPDSQKSDLPVVPAGRPSHYQEIRR